MMKALLLPLLCALAALLAPDAWAAQADRSQPLVIDGGPGSLRAQGAGRVELDGPVTATKGSLLLRASRLVATEQPDGSHRLVASSVPGTPVRFSQRTDRPGETMEGQADELDYIERSGIARFSGNARVRLLVNGQMQQELTGALIVYDTVKNEVMADGKPAATKAGEGGVRIVLMPKANSGNAASAPPAPAASVPLQTSPALRPQ